MPARRRVGCGVPSLPLSSPEPVGEARGGAGLGVVTTRFSGTAKRTPTLARDDAAASGEAAGGRDDDERASGEDDPPWRR